MNKIFKKNNVFTGVIFFMRTLASRVLLRSPLGPWHDYRNHLNQQLNSPPFWRCPSLTVLVPGTSSGRSTLFDEIVGKNQHYDAKQRSELKNLLNSMN